MRIGLILSALATSALSGGLQALGLIGGDDRPDGLAKALVLVLNMAVDIIGVDTASIILRDRDTDLLRVAAARGLPEEVVPRAGEMPIK